MTMLAISIGPMALPLPPLLLLGAVVTAQLLATRLARQPQAGDVDRPDGAPRRAAQARDARMPVLDVAALDSASRLTLPQAAQGLPAVVVLWASWCGPCREEMPLLAKAQQREPGVRFLFVNQGESESAVRRYLAGRGIIELGCGSAALARALLARHPDSHVTGLEVGALAAVLGAKATLEKRWLLAHHAGYAAYRQRTARFLPGVF